MAAKRQPPSILPFAAAIALTVILIVGAWVVDRQRGNGPETIPFSQKPINLLIRLESREGLPLTGRAITVELKQDDSLTTRTLTTDDMGLATLSTLRRGDVTVRTEDGRASSSFLALERNASDEQTLRLVLPE